MLIIPSNTTLSNNIKYCHNKKHKICKKLAKQGQKRYNLIDDVENFDVKN